MIPTFPEFKKIEISDKEEIENFTKDFPPYSDFDFVALFCWDVNGKRQISMLNGNLVVRSTSDITGKEFLTFLGTYRVPETIKELFGYAKKEGLKQELRMIPQETTNFCSDPTLKLRIKEDRDNFDYIYSLNDLCTYTDPKYSKTRYKYNKFMKEYGNDYGVKEFKIGDRNAHNHLANLWKEWCDVKEVYSEKEGIALRRLIDSASSFNLMNIMIFIGDTPVGFSINNITDNEYAVSYFTKTSFSYRGANQVLMKETAKGLVSKGCKFLNFEEDLGLPGLRSAKESYKPSFFLRKYSVRQSSLFQKILNVI
jgi:hypothetical protein